MITIWCCPFSPTSAEHALLTWLSISLMTRRTGLSRDADLRYRVFRLVPCSSVLYASRHGYPCTRAGKRRASWAMNSGKKKHIQQVVWQLVPQTIPFLQGLLSQKMAVNGAADASSLTAVPHACVLVPWAQLSAFTSHQNWHPSQSTAGVASPHDHNSKL